MEPNENGSKNYIGNLWQEGNVVPNIQSMMPLLGPAAVGLNFLEINDILNFIAFKPDNEMAGVC